MAMTWSFQQVQEQKIVLQEKKVALETSRDQLKSQHKLVPSPSIINSSWRSFPCPKQFNWDCSSATC